MNNEERAEFKETMHRRNTVMVEQKLIELEKMIRSQGERIDGLNATMTTLYSRLIQMEQTMNRLRIEKMGSGATAG